MEPAKAKKRIQRTVVSALLLAATLSVKLGGAMILGRFALGWRQWLDSTLSLLAVVLLAAFMIGLVRWMADSDLLSDWLKWTAVILCSLGTAALLAGYLFLFLLFGSFRDRVTEWEGRKVVAESTGIFGETGYRYVNWLVHGEQVYVWRD